MVTKIIVARIRPLLVDLVSPLQTAFIPRRKGVDNAIIIQELIHSMSSKKGRDGVMAIKIDLEKAYDLLEWDFIRDTLKLFKFPEHLSSIILSSISSATVSVLYNREHLNLSILQEILDKETPSLLISLFYVWKS